MSHFYKKFPIADLQAAGVVTRDDMNTEFWQQAGKYKAEIKNISLADCFAMTLANRLDAELITSDHHEFDPIAAKGLCRIKFIR